MKATRIALIALVLAGAAQSMALGEVSIGVRGVVGGSVGIDFFYNHLAPYGRWVERPSYGWVWAPARVRYGWRPYTVGRWVYTDYGWTWVSYERWGWATYHYGRWVFDPDYGWLWVPGYEWGPAWVAWQQGAGYIGWAPLPPSVGFSAGIGLRFGGVNLAVDIVPHAYCFVEERTFLSPYVTNYIVPPARNVTIINNTTNITNYTVVNNRVVNQGVAVQHVEQATGRRVQRLQVAEVSTTGGAAPPAARVSGNRVAMFRPAVAKSGTPPPPPPQSARAAVSAGQLSHQQRSDQHGLAAQHQAEYDQLRSIHQHERQAQAQGGTPQPAGGGHGGQRGQKVSRPQEATSADLAQRHQAELSAMRQQHQLEHRQLDARHQRDQQALQPAHVQAQVRGQQGREQRAARQSPPPPPQPPQHAQAARPQSARQNAPAPARVQQQQQPRRSQGGGNRERKPSGPPPPHLRTASA
ncbi:MAG TPA: DUF6600 domain-containing protein [Thermoanaerobaculia bacterium]|nr:DUF6600 domain-containing protein [Thermoanaerobaculia bacterium]